MTPEWRIRIVGEQDRSLGAEAYRLLCRILSFRVFEARKHHADLWEPFPITWTMVSLWLGLSRTQSYELMNQLEHRGYLKHTGVYGCPGKAHFRLVEAMADNAPFRKRPDRVSVFRHPRSPENRHPRGAKKRTPRVSENQSRLTKYSLREEMSTQREENSSLRSTGKKGERNGSLRSKASPEELKRYAGEMASLRRQLKGDKA